MLLERGDVLRQQVLGVAVAEFGRDLARGAQAGEVRVEPLDEQPDYLLFWEHLFFNTPAPHENGKIAIVGHTSQKTAEIFDLGHVICLDTFCHGGGWLTALDVSTGKRWQADKDGRLRPE